MAFLVSPPLAPGRATTTDGAELLGDLASLLPVLNAIPGYALLVDEEVSILGYNSAAARLLGAGRQEILRHRGGEVLHCVRIQDLPAGCGGGKFCRDCIIRSAVKGAAAGTRCVRRRFRLELDTGNATKALYVLLSAAALTHQGRRLVLLILEDVAELLQLGCLVPICNDCKRVRNEHQDWNEVEAYLKLRMDLSFESSCCPECAAMRAELTELRQRAAKLTPRERQVFELVTQGRLNKQIAAALGAAEKTVKIHRGRVMAKMGVRSVAELARLATRMRLLARHQAGRAESTPPAS